MHILVHFLSSSFEQSSKHREAKTTAIRGGTEMTFANRRGRYPYICKRGGNKYVTSRI